MTKSREEILELGYAHFLTSGAPFVSAGSADALVERYAGLAPERLLRVWRTLGLGTSHGGLVQFCDPEDHASTLEEILGRDAELRPAESLVYAHTAFGKLFVWNARWQAVIVNLLPRWVIPFSARTPPPEADRELRLNSELASLGPATCDLRDTHGKPLFERAVKKLGPLSFGEVYGFFPALALGGEAELAKLRRVRAREHFSILAQLGGYSVMDASKVPPQVVRALG